MRRATARARPALAGIPSNIPGGTPPEHVGRVTPLTQGGAFRPFKTEASWAPNLQAGCRRQGRARMRRQAACAPRF